MAAHISSSNFKSRIYTSSPRALQRALAWGYYGLPFPYRHGLEFTRAFNELMRSQHYPKERLEELQNERLRRLIHHAYEKVPYYRRVFKECSLAPKDIRTAEDLKKLPLLTKQDVREHFEELKASDFGSFRPVLQHTSGSTGEPLEYYLDASNLDLVKGCWIRHRSWAGVPPGSRVAVFRGGLIDDFGQSRERFWRRFAKNLEFSTFRMSDDVMADYVRELELFKSGLIRGYPSSLEILARFMKENGLSLKNPPRALQTSSEIVSKEQRELMEESFGAPLFDWYGHGEHTVAAGECEAHEGYHLCPEVGIPEFVKTEESEGLKDTFNLLGTSLNNYCMPFIRYDTEDLVVLKDYPQCECGRTLPRVKEIIGRRADIIEGANGVRVSPSSFVHFWKHRVAERLKNVRFSQIEKVGGNIRVNLVGEVSSDNERVMEGEIKNLLGDMDVEFNYLKEMPTGQKWRFTVTR